MIRRTLRRRALLGSVRADEVLPARVLCNRLGWARKSWAKARADGLPAIRYGRMDYCLGRDVLDFFGRLGGDNASSGGPRQ